MDIKNTKELSSVVKNTEIQYALPSDVNPCTDHSSVLYSY